MPVSNITVAPISAIYVGDASGMDPLTQISVNTTTGQSMTYRIGEEFLDAVGNSVQNGRAELTIDVTFFGNDETVIKLANGLALDATNAYDPSTFAKYTILLVHPDETKKSSILIPECYTLKRIGLNFNKDKVSVVPITFFTTNRNRFIQLFYLDTPGALATILDGRSPI